jgi:hypothetical protein
MHVPEHITYATVGLPCVKVSNTVWQDAVIVNRVQDRRIRREISLPAIHVLGTRLQHRSVWLSVGSVQEERRSDEPRPLFPPASRQKH